MAAEVGAFVLLDGDAYRITRVETAPVYWLQDLSDPDDNYELGPTVVSADDERLAPVRTIPPRGEE